MSQSNVIEFDTGKGGASSPCSLYLISPPHIADVKLFATELEAALSVKEGLVGAFQLRLKDVEVNTPEAGRTTLPTAREDVVKAAAAILKPICRRHDVAFILNDSPALAIACGADGVHIGQEDGSVAEVRAQLPEEMALGATCHDSRHLAMESGEMGADYVAFGAFFPTTSKTPEALAKWGAPEAEILHWWSTWTEVPCVAIGGITPENCRPLVDAGADFIAVITAVWDHPQGAAAAVGAFAKIFTEAGRG